MHRIPPRLVAPLLILAGLLLGPSAGKAEPASRPFTPISIEALIPQPVLIFSDPLTSADPVKGEVPKRVTGGEFTSKGWKTTANRDQLMIEIADANGFDGALEIDLIDLDWVKANTSHQQDKIAFLSMFSNPSGCPPANGSVFELGTAIPLAVASRTEGRQFRKVEFFAGEQKIGEEAPTGLWIVGAPGAGRRSISPPPIAM